MAMSSDATGAYGCILGHQFCSVMFCLVNVEIFDIRSTSFRYLLIIFSFILLSYVLYIRSLSVSSAAFLFLRQMVNTRQSTPKFSGPAFDEAVQRAKPRILSSANTVQLMLKTGCHIEKLFEVLGYADEFKARLASYKLDGDALNWWKAYKQAKGGEAYVAALSWKDFREIFFLQYFPRSEQKKHEREYHTIRQKDGELTGDFLKRFLRLAGFVGEKAGPPEEQAKHFKWALSN
ncbi:putative reverse transcriptase domain-containing protein [Tanacetum coccineum]